MVAALPFARHCVLEKADGGTGSVTTSAERLERGCGAAQLVKTGDSTDVSGTRGAST
jgi:hypothetical protein